MHFVLLNQFYYPTRAPTGLLLHDLALALRERGHGVTVITSAGVYGGEENAGDPADEEGISVFRIGRRGLHRTGFAAKLCDYLRFFSRARKALSQMKPAPDGVVSMTTPPFCGLIAARLKKKNKVPFILWCMDLYPEALAAGGILSDRGLLYRMLSAWARRERTQADWIVTLGPDMTGLIRRSLPGAPVQEIPVWSRLCATGDAAGEARRMRRERGWQEDEIILMYSGNMGRAHRDEEFVRLAHRLRETGAQARLVFCGEGPAKAEWMRRCGTLFEWIEPVGEDLLPVHLLSADIHLISQQPEWTGVVVPSKYQAACAAGRPVLFAGPADSAVAQWIRESGAGWILPPGDSSSVDRTVQEISDPKRVAAAAARVSGFRFDRETLAGRLTGLVEKTGGGRL